jgi:hypothetical protein
MRHLILRAIRGLILTVLYVLFLSYANPHDGTAHALFGVDDAVLIIAAAIAALSAGTSVGSAAYQNAQANARAKQAMEAARKQQAAQMVASQQQTLAEKNKRLNEAQLIRSRLRVAAGESGLGFGGTYEALVNQADYDAAANVGILQQNLARNILALSLGGEAQMASLVPVQTSPLLSGISGGLQGLSTGLAIAGLSTKGGGSGAKPASSPSPTSRPAQ